MKRKYLASLLFILPILAHADSGVKCNIVYTGDQDKWHGTEFSFMGILSGSYLYTCKDCGGVQINVSPASKSQSVYGFFSPSDFIKKTDSDYARKNISFMELNEFVGVNGSDVSIDEVGVANFYPVGSENKYVFYKGKNKAKSGDYIERLGFVISNGQSSCSIIASGFGKKIPPAGIAGVDYFMNNINLY
ncbi:TPA: hypothetical protein PXM42_004188 [Yersinia enterocolitica]|uniref:hypothetical protein n=1 Tax=Yersinia enterocolitica TaxID=630 RepID=UPI0033099FF9|nr:hypothetical protein [Yersinia enterocolitica]